MKLSSLSSWMIGGVVVPLSLSAMAGPSSVDEVVTSVEAKYAEVSSMQASFVQTTKSEVFGEDTQQGKVTLKRPAKMKWVFEGAEEKQFVTNGSTMWIYTKVDNQVIQYNNVSTSASAADALLGSLDRINELFDIKLLEGEADHHTLELKPKEEGQFKQMKLVLDASFTVDDVVITDAFDNVTELDFSDVKLNLDVPDTTFDFQIPAGAEVIDAGP